MDINSNLLRLKLDMVYRDMPLETAQTKFAEITATIEAPEPEAMGTVQLPAKPKARRKVIKALVPGSK